jgi:hypothetical protein
MNDFKSSLEQTIADANDKRRQQEENAAAARQSAQDAEQQRLDKLSRSKSLAYKFRYDVLDNMFKEAQTMLGKGGYSVTGYANHSDSENNLSHKISFSDNIHVTAYVEFAPDNLRVRLSTFAPRTQPYLEFKDFLPDSFDNESVGEWFKIHLNEGLKVILPVAPKIGSRMLYNGVEM